MAAARGGVRGVRGGHHKNKDQQLMRAVWRTAGWKARVKELLEAHDRCEWCNGKAGVINHIKQGFYEGYALCKREEVDIICQPCHQHWTKTGVKRQRLYDDCASCAAPIFMGRKKCFSCGSREIISKSDRTKEQIAELMTILESCPEVRISDRWSDIWLYGEVVVTGFEKQDLPWPMVKTDSGDVGLPAFKFGALVERGLGESYRDL